MEFSYDSYIKTINLLKECQYVFSGYNDYSQYNKTVIYRHDVDNSLSKALEIARIDYENNIKSTFFVLLSTNFYNIFSKESSEILQLIIKMGHDIGLHFDETKYAISDLDDLRFFVNKECEIMQQALDKQISTISMHRPSKWILENDIQFDNIINSYSKKYLYDFKYLSDSRMYWREDIINIIKSNKYDKLHILTHPFWYEENDGTINKRIENYINNAALDRYVNLKNNIRDLDEIIETGCACDGNKS